MAPTADPVESRESPWFFYQCAHGSSNTPCPWHFPEGSPEMPDDWMTTYVAPKPPGLTDEADVLG